MADIKKRGRIFYVRPRLVNNLIYFYKFSDQTLSSLMTRGRDLSPFIPRRTRA